jgi:hypothetical protein
VIGVVAALLVPVATDYFHYSRLSHAGRRLHIGMMCDAVKEAIGEPHARGVGAGGGVGLDANGKLRLCVVWTYRTVFDWDGVPGTSSWKGMPYWLERMSPGQESCDEVLNVWFYDGKLVSVNVPYRFAGLVENAALAGPSDSADSQ